VETLTDVLNDEDYLVVVSPTIKDDKWVGAVDLHALSAASTKLSNGDKEELEYLCKMMCATIPLMEMDEDFRDFVIHYVDNYMVDEEVKKGVSFTREGNVIRGLFGEETEFKNETE